MNDKFKKLETELCSLVGTTLNLTKGFDIYNQDEGPVPEQYEDKFFDLVRLHTKFCLTRWNSSYNLIIDIGHATSAWVGEYLELEEFLNQWKADHCQQTPELKTKIIKELGDLFFYACMTTYLTAQPIETPWYNTYVRVQQADIEDFMDKVKKRIYYCDNQAIIPVQTLFNYMNDVMFMLNCPHIESNPPQFTFLEVAKQNNIKLRSRHPKGFTVESSRAKVDEV